jgi:hypothetical protein
MNYVTLSDFLTAKEIDLAVRMWRESQHDYARRVCAAITKPHIQRINKALGQGNDPMYLAYVIEYAMTKYWRSLQ